MKAIMKKVGELPELVDIPETVKAMKKMVDGPLSLVGSEVCTGNFIVDREAQRKGKPFNCSIEGRKFYGTIIYTGPWVGDFTDAGQDAIKRYKAQAAYGNLGKERWVWC